MERGSTDPVSPVSYKSLQNVRVVKAEDRAAAKARTVVPPDRTPVGSGHYRAYKPRPFMREERDRVTILFGGLHWRAERVIQGAMENLGYKATILPTATREDLLTGREVADIGQCCPTSFSTGNLANYLRSEAKRIGAEEVSKNFIYVTAGSCGACRFGQYHQSYELALRNVGLDSFRMFLLGQEGLDQGPAAGGGLELNLPFTLGAVWAIVLTDVIQDMEYQIRPYEKNPGETERVSREAVEYVYDVFRNRPWRGRKWSTLAWHLGTNYFAAAMREVRRRFDRIEVDRLRVRPLVKITGEFYLQTVEGDPNYNIHRWLEAEGAEVYPAAITIWLDYLMRLAGQEFEDHIGLDRHARLKLAGIRAGQALLRWTHGRMRRAMGEVPREMPDQYELRALAAPYYHSRLNGGEGDMLVGKALWAYHHKKAHKTCELSPYSCMPNTMSIGAMAAVLGKYPDLLYAPLEIKGDAEVHALSRCQMILTEAKKRAQREYESVLAKTGLTDVDLRAAVAARPELSRATYRVPRYGAAGTAANLALHIAAGRGR
jgi:predicted nucleotide-binding protein (sugar kinase/HSP70/actin superfamily)